MNKDNTIAIYWFRRDLRIFDNLAFSNALQKHEQVLPIFIFSPDDFGFCKNENDIRYSFVYNQLQKINEYFNKYGASLHVFYGKPINIFKKLTEEFIINAIYASYDYEPYELDRDKQIDQFARQNNFIFERYHTHCIFEPSFITKSDGTPYTIFTPYSRKWFDAFFKKPKVKIKEPIFTHLYNENKPLPSPEQLHFKYQEVVFPENKIDIELLKNYEFTRDFPAADATSKLSAHLRWGTISIENLCSVAASVSPKFLNELVWREFYKMILYFFPNIITQSFKPKYDNIQWLNNEADFEKWCNGNTGYPIVDAGMRQLNETGFMHNRVRMITASFLCKHLLIDWRWGEAYFAEKLLDYDAAANVGGWQWAAGSGCDPVPYFRIFNPVIQAKKFDADNIYIKRWVKEWGTADYVKPMVNHELARQRCLQVYKKALME